MSGILRAASAAVLIVVLAGCAVSEGEPSASPVTEPTGTPVPTESPASGFTDPATWTIGFNGVGPIDLGDDIDEVRASIVGFEEFGQDGECPWVTFFRDGDLELWLVLKQPELRMVEEIVVLGPGPTTEEGIGVGAEFAATRAAYPGATEYVGIGESLNLSVSAGDDQWIHFVAGSEDELVATIGVSRFSGLGYEYCG